MTATANDSTSGLGLARAYKRWRHRRGYGVHSPFAYRLVRLAIAPGIKYGYYGYHDIEEALLQHGDSVRHRRVELDARLLLGLMAQTGTARCLIHTAPDARPASADAFAAAAHALAIPCIPLAADTAPRPGDFIVMAGSADVSGETAAAWLHNGAACMALDPAPQLRDALMQWQGRGLLLYGTRILAAIPNTAMDHTRYSMTL